MYHLTPPAIPRTLGELAAFLGLPLPAGASESLSLLGVKPLDKAIAGEVSVLSNPSYADAARKTGASVVLTTTEGAQILPAGCFALITPEPYVAFARSLGYFYPVQPVTPGIASSAVVSGSATVHESARIEPGAILYAGVIVNEGAHIGAYTILGPGVVIGAHTRISPHCSIFRANIGKNCTIHSGVAIGQDGFGFALEGKTLHKVPQLGGVTIGNDVEIGANCTIDAGALEDTVLEDHVKLDNQVQIAHNARIGASTRIVAQSGIAGSTTLGTFNLIGGQSGVVGHITTAPGTALAARSGLTKSTTEQGAVLAGMPAKPISQWQKEVAVLSRLAKKKEGESETTPPIPQPKLVKVTKSPEKTSTISGPDTDASPF